jgi:hypothetical protein
VKEEVSKLLKVGFVMKIKCAEWIANMVFVNKSNGSWRMCVDYLMDVTAKLGVLSFMDAFSEDNQIKMFPVNEHKTTFMTGQGLYCYKVILFGLKNT